MARKLQCNPFMNYLLRYSALLGIFSITTATIGACTDSEVATPIADDAQVADDVKAADGGVDVGTTDAGGMACAAFASELQTGLDQARGAARLKHAAIGVWTPKCGAYTAVSTAPNAAPIAKDALWRLGNTTQTYVAAAALRLADRGELNLEDTVDRYLPEFPRAHDIKLRYLMNHTSGIADYMDSAKMQRALDTSPLEDISVDELLKWGGELAPKNLPGLGWSYSHTNYVVLGRIIEQTQNAKIEVVLRRELFTKLDLRDTYFAGPEQPPRPLVPGFDGNREVTSAYSMSAAWAAGAVAATPADVVTWLRALYLDRRVLSAAGIAAMQTPYAAAAQNRGADFGLGVDLVSASRTLGSGYAVGHGPYHPETILGYSNQVFAFPQSDWAIATFASDIGTAPNAITAMALHAYQTLQDAP
jgi:D-alanyl-D-alanine carboxypeptidase